MDVQSCPCSHDIEAILEPLWLGDQPVLPAVKANPQQVSRAGEHFVAAELHRRGAYAVTFAGNMPIIDVLASDKEQKRTVSVQVKTKSGTSRGWQTDIRRGKQRVEDTNETRYWILVNLGTIGSSPGYYVVPEWWIQNDIYETHLAYLDSHGGVRPHAKDSTHHQILPKRVEQWRDRWDELGIFIES